MTTEVVETYFTILYLLLSLYIDHIQVAIYCVLSDSRDVMTCRPHGVISIELHLPNYSAR